MHWNKFRDSKLREFVVENDLITERMYDEKLEMMLV